MSSTTTLTLVDGVRIAVPDSLNLITPYVLQEQQDWFEDEIKFLRKLLQPGWQVIDIGASYGVYTLSMAHTVGSTGHVWAFEPASSTAQLLSESISINGFSHVTLEQSALSGNSGTAQLALNKDPELNALIHDSDTADASETVPVVTLDECLQKYNWRNIDFIKIDTEGEGSEILKGSAHFFAGLSPLIQYEIKTGETLHMELVQNFATLGYTSYRLVPGLNLLIPFDAQSTPDKYLLNLFCCKQDRARQLATAGFLIESVDHFTNKETTSFKNISAQINNNNAYNWRQTIAKLPYGVQLEPLWEQTTENHAEVNEALSFYFFSQDSSQPATDRFNALDASFNLFKMLCEHQPSHLRLGSFARIARDYGARSLAIDALYKLYEIIFQQKQIQVDEPFLAPARYFDTVPPGENIGDWVLAAVLEEFEKSVAFSSFYTGVTSKQRLDMIRALGFGSAEMERRLQLLQKRYGLPL